MKWVFLGLVAILSLASCGNGASTRGGAFPIAFAVPDGCTLQQGKGRFWQCTFPSRDGHLRLIQISEGVFPAPPDQILEMEAADSTARQTALREMINDLENTRVAGFNHSKYSRIKSEFLAKNRVPSGYTTCLSTRESFVERRDDMTNARAYLHCWGWDPSEGAFNQLVFSYLEGNAPSRKVSASFDQDAARVMRSIKRL